MICPKCGVEVADGSAVCPACGAPLQSISDPAPMTLKSYINNFCDAKMKKDIKSCWIVLYVCAGLTAAVQIAAGTLPLDGIILAVLAFWMQRTYSKASAIVTVAYAVVSIVITLLSTGQFSGWLILLAGVYALVNILKADKAFKAYQEKGSSTQI